jgi:integrase
MSDHLWYPVFRVGDRVIGIKPEREPSDRGFYEWWRRVEATAGVRHRKPHMTRHTFATDVPDATEGDLLRREGVLGALLDLRHRGLPPLVEDAHRARRQGSRRVPPQEPSNRSAP